MERRVRIEGRVNPTADHRAVVQALEPAVARHLDLLAPIDRAWQPSDYLPDLEGENWRDQVDDFRRAAQAIPDDLLVVLVGDMVTEEALPSYSVSLNELVRDDTGTSETPWARWLRGWTAEENRHGDVLNAYLRLTGRVNMRAVERTIHHLLARGFNPHAQSDPYDLLVYTSFQERATRISHSNVGKIAARVGDLHLGRICGVIAGDEARHETFYTRIMSQVFDHDPEGGLLACDRMLRSGIAMPGQLMHDGCEPNLFDRFASVAQRTEIYTVRDYASIIEHLVSAWGIAGRQVTGRAAHAQESICRQAARYGRLADRAAARLRHHAPVSFSWIRGRQA